MSILNQIAFFQERRDEVPNQELARRLAEGEDRAGIAEIAAHLEDDNAAVASDCIKVLYEIGYLRPELIRGYAAKFLELLGSKNNRMVWGAMIALSTIAPLEPETIWQRLDLILGTMEKGTVITQDAGVKALAHLCRAREEYARRIAPLLLERLEGCRAADLARWAEVIAPAMREKGRWEAFAAVLEKREGELKESARAKVRRMVKGRGE